MPLDKGQSAKTFPRDLPCVRHPPAVCSFVRNPAAFTCVSACTQDLGLSDLVVLAMDS